MFAPAGCARRVYPGRCCGDDGTCRTATKMRLLRPSARVYPGSTKRNRRRRRSEMSDASARCVTGHTRAGSRSVRRALAARSDALLSAAIVGAPRQSSGRPGSRPGPSTGATCSRDEQAWWCHRSVSGSRKEILISSSSAPLCTEECPRLRLRRAEPPARLRRHVHDPVRSLTPPPVPHRHLKTRQFVRSESRSRRTTFTRTRSSR